METFNPLLGIALIFAAGYAGGLVARRLHMPSVTGNILAGVVVGPSVLGLLGAGTARSLEPVTMFAMGLITVVIGGHLSYRRLHNAKRRILSVTLFETILTAVLVFFGVFWAFGNLNIALILAAIATATAPATVLSVFREERAKGLMVKTALASVALDNVICITLFAAATSFACCTVSVVDSVVVRLASAATELTVSAVVGGFAGWLLLKAVRRKFIAPFSGLLFGVLAATGGAELAGLSPLLTNMAMGIVLGNGGRDGDELVGALEHLEPMVVTCFFTLAGVDLHLSSLPEMGMTGAVYFIARGIGKTFGAGVGSVVGGAPPRVSRGMYTVLLPQAGLAIGLLVILQGDPRFTPEFVDVVTNVVLATVVLNEIFGPPLVRRAVRASDESGKDRRRLVEFLQEEYILYPLKAEDKWEAIRKLGDFLLKTHGVRDITLDELCETVEAREREFSTAIGSGVALPHARLKSGPEIMGVMGLCPRGVEFDAPDGEPVRAIILIATPEGHEGQHLEVMGAVAGLMRDDELRAHLLTARSSAEIFEIIEDSSKQDYNYFVED